MLLATSQNPHLLLPSGHLGQSSFAYRPNRSTDDAIALATNTTLTHLNKGKTSVRCSLLITGHRSTPLFPQNSSDTQDGTPQGCVLSPILYPSSPTTAQPSTAPTPSLSLQMTQPSWASSQTMTRVAERRGRHWRAGARQTTCLSMSAKQSRWSWITDTAGRWTPPHPHRDSSFMFLGVHVTVSGMVRQVDPGCRVIIIFNGKKS